MSVHAVGLIGFALVILLILIRIPVGIAIGLVGFLGYASIDGFSRALYVLGQAPYDVASGYTLSVVPLFILMGELAMRSGMSGKLYRSARALMTGVRGSQALATIAACAGFGAICGSSLATAATMTRIAVPEMRRLRLRRWPVDRLGCGRRVARHSHSSIYPLRHIRVDCGTVRPPFVCCRNYSRSDACGTVHGRHSGVALVCSSSGTDN